MEEFFSGRSQVRNTTFELIRRDGTTQTLRRVTYHRQDAVAILLHDPARKTVLLTKQFRYPAYVNGHPAPLIEVCAGLLDAHNPETAIVKEAMEECGVTVTNPRRVFECFMSPGSVTEKLTFFVADYSPATRVGVGGGFAQEGEDIEVIELPLTEALAMAMDGRICDAKIILLLQWAALHLAP